MLMYVESYTEKLVHFLRKKLLRDLILFLCSFSTICVVQVIINESGVWLSSVLFGLSSMVNLRI